MASSALIDKYRYWFALREAPGVGSVLYKRLITAFGSPEAVFNATLPELKNIRGMTSRALKGIQQNKALPPSREINAIHRAGYKIVVLNEPCYPTLLKQIPDPPPILTYIGSLHATAPCISIVGSRRATTYGLETAFRLAGNLGCYGFDIVSGMALGIDTAAHKGALDSGARTLAVLGSGLNTIYPRQNRSLSRLITANGAVISELPINSGPDARHFPMRNRIIAGLSVGTIVVEAACRSGSLITARLTAEYNREVFAVPGSIRSFKSTGTHALLKQGARLVENEQDVLDELPHLVHPENKTSPVKATGTDKSDFFSPDDVHKKVLNCLGPYPVHMDTIIHQSGLETGVVSASLLELELTGVVIQTPGKHFVIAEEKS